MIRARGEEIICACNREMMCACSREIMNAHSREIIVYVMVCGVVGEIVCM